MFSLGDRASFFVPDDIEQRLKTGSRERYDPRLQSMVYLVKKYRRGYDQEGYIIEENL